MEQVTIGRGIILSVSQAELRLKPTSVGEALECVDWQEFHTRL
jgi:hypothetical protein